VESVELGGVGGERQPSLPPGRGEHPPDHGERAPLRAAVPVLGRAGAEDRDGEHHGRGRHAVAPSPAHVVLHVHQHGDREQRPQADAEVEPAEEEHHGALLPRVAPVELVRPEPGHVRLQPAAARRDRVQRRVEERELPAVRRDALVRAVAPGVDARRRTHARRRRVRRQQAHSRGRDGRGDGYGEVAAELGVGEEAANEGEQVERAHEVGDDVGRLGVGEVQLADEVRHQVHGDAHHAHALRQLRAQDEPRAQPPAGPGLVHRVPAEVHGLLPVVAVAVPTTMASGRNLHDIAHTRRNHKNKLKLTDQTHPPNQHLTKRDHKSMS
jgi:hypothetical protein